jgi:hypothetical protein
MHPWAGSNDARSALVVRSRRLLLVEEHWEHSRTRQLTTRKTRWHTSGEKEIAPHRPGSGDPATGLLRAFAVWTHLWSLIPNENLAPVERRVHPFVCSTSPQQNYVLAPSNSVYIVLINGPYRPRHRSRFPDSASRADLVFRRCGQWGRAASLPIRQCISRWRLHAVGVRPVFAAPSFSRPPVDSAVGLQQRGEGRWQTDRRASERECTNTPKTGGEDLARWMDGGRQNGERE